MSFWSMTFWSMVNLLLSIWMFAFRSYSTNLRYNFMLIYLSYVYRAFHIVWWIVSFCLCVPFYLIVFILWEISHDGPIKDWILFQICIENNINILFNCIALLLFLCVLCINSTHCFVYVSVNVVKHFLFMFWNRCKDNTYKNCRVILSATMNNKKKRKEKIHKHSIINKWYKK